MTLQLVGMAEEIFLGLNVPQAVMGLAETIELGVDRIGLALLLELSDRCQRHLDVGVDQLFTTFDFRKTQSGLRHNVQASNMSNKTSRILPLPMRSRASFMSSVLPPLVPTMWVEA